jgi:hypothetical protein
MFSWFSSHHQGIREDRRHLKSRARRLLQSYLTSNAWQKQQYYQVIAGAAAACQPAVSDPSLRNETLAELTGEAAMNVVKLRTWKAKDEHDHSAVLITDAYATVAIASGRWHLCS